MMRLNSAVLAVMAFCVVGVLPGTSSTAFAQNNGQAGAAKAPFDPLPPAAQAQLAQVLGNWEQQSKGTKTLELKFVRYHYDGGMAPAGNAATKAQGEIKYAAPDQGLIRVDQLVFFNGMVENQPSYKAFADRFGEHWVCNGKQLIEFDRTQKECKIEDLPPAMQGKNIINSPLPFVFNLDAAQLQQRYWVRQTQAPSPKIILLEVWPKTRDDRSQYKMVQVALEAKTYTPKAIVMYAPNFDPKTAAIFDHYEFTDVKRNSLAGKLSIFLKNFIPSKPPKDWKIVRGTALQPPQPGAGGPNGSTQQATRPASAAKR